MRASELLLIVRAQNQASGALRRLAGDLRGLSQMQQLQRRGESLQIARQQLQLQRQRSVDEIKSLETGRRAIMQQRAVVAQKMAGMQADLRASGVQQSMLRNNAALLRNQAQQSRLQRASQFAPTPQMRGEFAKNLQAARLQEEALNMEQGRLAEKANVAAAAIEREGLALKGLDASAAKNAARVTQLQGGLGVLGDRLRLNAQDIKENNKAMNAARWDKLATGGRVLQHTARVAEYAGLVLGGSLAVVANNAAKFDTSVTLAATQTRKIGQSFTATSKNSKILQADIRNLMTEFPASADDFSKAAYDIYSSTDVNFGKGRKALKLFAQAAVAGQTDVQTATDAGIVVLNNFGNSVEKLPNRIQRMFAAVRFGRMTFKDFATSLSTIGPAARAANQSFDEMSGTFAFLTRHLDVAKARVGFARLLDVLSSPKMLSGLQKAGINIQNATGHLIPLDQIIGKIVKKFPGLKDGGTDAMNFFKNMSGNTGTIQARRAFTFLVQFFDKAGKDGASYLDMLRKVKGDNNEFTMSLKAMEKTTGVRWGVFVNQLKALALEIGADLVPALLKMAGPIQDIVRWWQRLDAGTRATVAKFATYTAAFLLVGGAVTFLSGTFMRLFATMGRFAGFGGATLATLLAVGAAIAILTGNFHSLSDVLDMVTNFAFSSWQGAVITVTALSVGVLRLVSALKGLAAVQAVGGAAGAGGLLGGLISGGRGIGRGFATGREIGGLKVGLMGAATAAGSLSLSLLPIAATVATVGVALYAWHRHMQQVQRDAEKVQRAFDIGAAGRLSADRFQQLPGTQEDLTRASIDVRNYERQIRELKKELKGTTGDRRGQILDDIRLASLNLADAQRSVATFTEKSNREFRALSESFGQLGTASKKIRDLQREMAHERGLFGSDRQMQDEALRTDSRFQNLKKQLAAVQDQARATAQGLPRVFNQVVTGLSKIGKIKMPDAKTLQDMFRVAMQKGRMLTLPEMKAIIKAEVDPKSLAALPKKLQAQLKTAIKVRVETTGASVLGNIAGQLAGKKKVDVTAVAHTGKAKQAMDALAKPINKTINLHTSKDPTQMGQDIASGIQAGINSVSPTVTVSVHIQKYIDTFKKTIKSGSPSRLFADVVGAPIAQGISVGILEQQGLIEKTATAAITFFESAALQKAAEAKKKISDALLISDISMQAKTLTQFNNAIAKLGKRKVPRELIDQLAALGPDQAKLISQIANMSEKELRRYVAAWRKANAQVKRSNRETMDDIKKAQKDAMNQAVDNLQGMFNDILQQNTDQFGGMFDGLDSMIGQGFKDAMDQYNSSVADLKSQIADANQQIVDAQQEAQQRLIDAINSRKDELQQAMGALFSGSWMQGTEVQTKLDWGKKLGFDDLQKDLQSQVDKFKRWRADLTSLAAKVPPELAKQLEDLGPDAVDQLDVLNSGTADQLAQYVSTWKDGQDAIQAVANKTTVDTSDITARISDLVKTIDDLTHQIAQLQMPHELTGQDIIDNIKKQQEQWIDYQNTIQALIDKGLPMELIEQLRAMGPDALPYLKAIVGMSDDQLQDLIKTWGKNQAILKQNTIDQLNEQLKLWYNYGKGIVANITSGISSESAKMQAWLKQWLMAMISGGSIPGPPGVTFGDTPPYTLGNSAASSSQGAGNTNWRQFETPQSTTTVHMQVNAVQDESLDTVLQRAQFRIQNNRPT